MAEEAEEEDLLREGDEVIYKREEREGSIKSFRI